jgi:hypothetical protein
MQLQKITMTHRIFALVLLVIQGLGFQAKAQNTDSVELKGTSGIYYNNVSDFGQGTLPVVTSPYAGLNHQPVKAVLKAALDLGDVYRLGTLPFGIEVNFTIAGKNASSQAVFSENKTLSILPSKPEQMIVYDFIGSADVLDHVTISITGVNRSYLGITEDPAILAYINDSLRLTVSYSIDYRVDVRATHQGPELTPTINALGNTILNSRIQTFSWNNATTKKFPNYQFQLLKLNNKNPANVSSPTSITAEVDWSRALTIETESSDKNLTITIAEGTGFYVWRVRPIGTFFDGGISNSRNYGAWSYAPAQANEVSINLSNITGAKHYFYYEEPNDGMNWIYSRVFTEGNRMSEQITYANELNQTRQTQSYMKSNGKSLIAQTVSDYSGRPAVSTIPVPVAGGLTGYKEKLASNSQNKPYSADDFDKDSNYKNPSPVNSGGFYDYYSDVNPDYSIPDAQGFPYTRTLFENTSTGRPLEQSGVGKTHAIGNIIDEKGRTVKTYYSNPSDEELLRIFGNEAPKASSVLKTVTVDANNTTSVAYASNEGNVIATCMAYSEDDTLLSPLGIQPVNFEITNYTTQNVPFSKGFMSSKRVAFSTATPVNIAYEISCKALELGCIRVQADCGYEVQFFIHDLNKNVVYQSGVLDLDGITCIGGYKYVSNITDWTPSILNNTLEAGTYIISKKIISKANAHAQIQVSTDQTNNRVEPLVTTLTGWLQNVTNDNKLSNYFFDVQNLGQMLEDGHTLNPTNNNQSVYDDIKSTTFMSGMHNLDSLVFDTAMHVFFDVPYTGSGAQPKMLIIQGGCCGPIKIPVNYVPPFVCHPRDTIIADTTKIPDFSGYLTSVLADYMTESNKQFSDFCPGYTPYTLNRMVFHMLTDQYYAGATKLIGGERKKINGTDILDEDRKVQYKCDKLWNCWIATISGYQEMLTLNGMSGNVSEGVDEESDDDASVHDEHADKESEESAGGGVIMQWLIKKAMSKRLREDADQTTKDFKVNLVEQFLNCTGFKFAGIVNPGVEEALATDQLEYYDVSQFNQYDNQAFYKHFQDSLWIPFIKSPVFAFKYFEYVPSSSYKPVEISFCYENYDHLNLCDNICKADYYHLDWGVTERLNFYGAIKGYIPLVAEQSSDPEILTVCPPDLQARYNNLITSCNTYCEQRRTDIYNNVLQVFEKNCYEIGGCPEDDNVVLISDINAIVDAVIANCQDQCHDIDSVATDLNTYNPAYPFCVQKTCNLLNADGSLNPVTFQSPELLPACEWKRFNQIKYWHFEMALESIDSKCNPALVVELPDNPNKVECINGTPVEDGYSKTYKLEVKVD